MEINGRTTVGMRENWMIFIANFHYIHCLRLFMTTAFIRMIRGSSLVSASALLFRLSLLLDGILALPQHRWCTGRLPVNNLFHFAKRIICYWLTERMAYTPVTVAASAVQKIPFEYCMIQSFHISKESISRWYMNTKPPICLRISHTQYHRAHPVSREIVLLYCNSNCSNINNEFEPLNVYPHEWYDFV